MSEIDLKASQVIKKDKPSFLTDEEESELKQQQMANQQQSSSHDGQMSAESIPKELKCPFGDHIIRDAVLVPCCGHFVCCDECIRQKISNDENIECPHADCDQEIGSLGSITPYHETRKKVPFVRSVFFINFYLFSPRSHLFIYF